MINPQFALDLNAEIIVDNFAGGGGASTGIELALGRNVDIAINHDPEAVAMHRANHPQTKHYCESVFDVDPIEITHGRPVGLAWFSPDCKHFSKAKGGKPKSKKIRGLAWIVLHWVNQVAPRVIMLENVEEFQGWAPLDKEGSPLKHRKGWFFKCFVGALRRRGYAVEYRELRACDYGAPTIRKRFFLIARCDGKPIVWPDQTHGEPKSEAVKSKKLAPWRTAAECIEWPIECPSIFTRKKDLADATLRRIAKGIMRYVVNAEDPFIVPDSCAPFITECANASTERVFAPDEPLRTQCAQIKGGHFALVTAFLSKMRGDNVGSDMREPLHTISAGGMHHAEVRAMLIKYYGNEKEGVNIADPMHTVTSKERFALVLVKGVLYEIIDIGLRMLQPIELYRAQGFPKGYIFEWGHFECYETGLLIKKKLTKKAQVRMCGNSVCPPVAEALVRANVPDMCVSNAFEEVAV
ncbi:DNA cytosine methyltransferase [Coraliomargarita sp. SDUM461003]|uniref:DNA (cytosine-5-)-methyltransferase n=1 Tax=Thalassobacterium maritimum TaxID=3041265 RepID=A0ABU1APZ0_9BACT|nr:DNA cytosine methyltransferase [Coraliomargarita sp. SDUM461003]MDQ8206203.1 DNA cytosine methyltransferase [Coraliomargarita sp. SDUM461003]